MVRAIAVVGLQGSFLHIVRFSMKWEHSLVLFCPSAKAEIGVINETEIPFPLTSGSPPSCVPAWGSAVVACPIQVPQMGL